MDRRRRRGFILPKRPYTDPPRPSSKPESKPTIWVGGAKGSFAKGSPAAPIARLTPQSVGEAVLKLSAEVKRLFHVDLADPPDWVNYRFVEDNAHVIDFRFPPDAPVPNMIARIEVRSELLETVIRLDATKQLTNEFKRLGFNFVTVDMEGFQSGKLNRTLVPLELPGQPKQQQDGSQ